MFYTNNAPLPAPEMSIKFSRLVSKAHYWTLPLSSYTPDHEIPNSSTEHQIKLQLHSSFRSSGVSRRFGIVRAKAQTGYYRDTRYVRKKVNAF
jgi:hypothetical protein